MWCSPAGQQTHDVVAGFAAAATVASCRSLLQVQLAWSAYHVVWQNTVHDQYHVVTDTQHLNNAAVCFDSNSPSFLPLLLLLLLHADYFNPRMVVGCVVEHEGKILLCKRCEDCLALAPLAAAGIPTYSHGRQCVAALASA
jgi:hypothetical protein